MKPNFVSIEEALARVAFPISKRDLMEQLDDSATALYRGRNLELRTLVRDLDDDFFDSEEELHGALERQYGTQDDDEEHAGVLPTGPTGSWQADVGKAKTGGTSDYFEPGP